MIWTMEAIYYIGALLSLIVAIYSFLRGFNVLQRLEEKQWIEQFQQSIEAIDKAVPTTEPINQ